MPTEAKPITRKPVLIDLALQGGGSHGAFTWGVLDYLLEDGRLAIEGISGTSAGAVRVAAHRGLRKLEAMLTGPGVTSRAGV